MDQTAPHSTWPRYTDRQTFESIMARPVSVITSVTPSDKVVTMPAVASYSLSPPSIVLSLDSGSAVEARFGLSVLAAHHRPTLDTIDRPATEASNRVDGWERAVPNPLLHLACRTSFTIELFGGVLLVATVHEISFGHGLPLVWLNGAMTETQVTTPSSSREPREFPDAMAHLASAVYVVTGWDRQQRPRGFTATSVVPHGTDRRFVVVSIDHAAFSHDALVGGDYICLNLLSDDQSETARVFASKRADKFDHIGWSNFGTMPVLEKTAGFAVCRVARIIPHGDHTLVVAEISRSESSGALPLLYWQRSFASPQTSLNPEFSPIGAGLFE